MQIRLLGVVGGGTMGQGIVQVASQVGFNVFLQERSKEAGERAIAAITEQLDRSVAKWGITEKEKQLALSRITTTDQYQGFEKVDLVVEAVDEDLQLKNKIFQTLHSICKDKTIFASNTSTLSVSNLARESGRAAKFIGMHFQPPVPKKPIIELVRGLDTSNETYEAVRKFSLDLKKTPIEVFEWPGYLTTRVIMPLINEAAYALMEGVASASDIDKAMELGCGMEMGPLHLADAMGLDTVVFQMEHMFHELGDLKYRPCPLLKKMIRAGHLGVKSGNGFFEYERPEAAKIRMSVAI